MEMDRSLRYLVYLLLPVAGCTTVPEERPEPAPEFVELQGEFYTEGDYAFFMPCGADRVLQVTGPATDSVIGVYDGLRSNAQERVKAWVEGAVIARAGSEAGDSVLRIRALQHMAIGLRCPALPNARMSGRYRADALPRTANERTILMDLFPDGLATKYTDLHDGKGTREEDGEWGQHADGLVRTYWPMVDKLVMYRPQEGKLAILLEDGSALPMFVRIGDVEYKDGMRRETFALVAEVVARQGRQADPDTMSIVQPLALYFPNAAAMDSLQQVVNARMGWTGSPRIWEKVHTVGDLVGVLRSGK